jgi:hypothetical protein
VDYKNATGGTTSVMDEGLIIALNFDNVTALGDSLTNRSSYGTEKTPSANLVGNTGTSNIVDVVMDKPIVPVAEVDTFVDTTSTTTPAVTTPVVTTPAVTTPAVTTPVTKKKPNTLMYAGIGVGVLVLGYFGYKMFKK